MRLEITAHVKNTEADNQVNASIERLLSISSASLSPLAPKLDFEVAGVSRELKADLLAMLRQKNGFYAFESALHVFPDRASDNEIGLLEWNAPSLWKNEYQGLADGCLFFAEDIFGVQFCIKDNGVYSFDPETGHCDFFSPDISTWSALVLDDYEVLTGYPVAHEWQILNGAIATGTRLIPIIPFVTGGDYLIENLFEGDSVQSMCFRASIAAQIIDIPDGSTIRLKIEE